MGGVGLDTPGEKYQRWLGERARCAYLLSDAHARKHARRADPGVATEGIDTQTKGPVTVRCGPPLEKSCDGCCGGAAPPAVVNCIKAVSGSMATF